MTKGLRLAALKLHGVGAADRDWILDRLDRRERRRLVALLRDLKRSGIGAGSFDALGTDAVKQEIAARPEPQRAELAAAGVPAELAQADAEAVARALHGEPEWVRSTILAMHPWKWRRAVLERFAGSDADTVGRSAPVASAPRPAFAAALARSLARRIGALHAAGSPFERVMDNLDPPTRAPRARVWERLRKWIA